MMTLQPMRDRSGAPLEFQLASGPQWLLRCLRNVEGFANLLKEAPPIEVRVRGATDEDEPLVPQAIKIEINPADPEGPEQHLKSLDANQNCIILHNVLQYLDDYRRFIGAAFDKLAVSGFLLIVVPHQFLLERKLVLPSRINRSHKKFYTPAVLMTEVEEAIDPLQYRVRVLLDNDLGYDYSVPLNGQPSGGSEIVLYLE
jgi:hypothetical protein